MKITCVLFLTVPFFCNSQIIDIPDPNFKARLLVANATNGYACIGASVSGCLPGVIDINGNNEIEVSEALNVAKLNLDGANISNLTGIEYFTNLERLDCGFNNLTSINLDQLTSLVWLQCFNNHIFSLDLSNLLHLKILGCRNNQLISLNINNQTQLEFLVVSNNYITSLDFTHNPALQRVYCGNNLLTSLDFGANPQFFDLGCKNNPNLTSINIRNGMIQAFGAGTYYNECWSNLPNLSYICADGDEIPALQSFLTGCGVTQNITIDSACPLSVNEYELNSLIITPNPSNGLFQLSFASKLQQEVVYAVYDVLGKKLSEKKVSFENNSIEINLTDYPAGVYQLSISVGETVVNKKLVKK